MLATAARESRLSSAAGDTWDRRQRAFARHVLDVVGSCRVHRFDDVSADAPPKRSSTLGDSIRLRWRQRGLDRVFTAAEISDGTMRFICSATLLLGPDRPATIILDEPELGLHPFAIHQLAALVRGAATEDRRVILATESVTLLSQFTIDETVVVQRPDGGTVAEHVDAHALDAFLDDFSLGAMWEMNLLGGRPTPEQTRA